ncbi:hypothetical protein B0H63DRAFT_509819 [Podospora didyma]|uniref:Secreted protein n=1 Tax=Podospora didyma TaxID=330526 RepID=A0AAE0TZ34_9PEZI|nr:hypothetical protein B0H63DRAFT_509819 [Podospora didyma]
MHSSMSIAIGLLVLGANAATTPSLSSRQDPVLFTYKVGQGSDTCSTLSWTNLQSFHQSQLPASGCVVWKDFLGGSEIPVVSLIVAETPKNSACTVLLYPDASCQSSTQTALTSLHCGNSPWASTGGWKSFSLRNCI